MAVKGTGVVAGQGWGGRGGLGRGTGVVAGEGSGVVARKEGLRRWDWGSGRAGSGAGGQVLTLSWLLTAVLHTFDLASTGLGSL